MIRCPKCSNTFRVPAPADQENKPKASPPAKRPAEDRETTRKKAQAQEVEEEDADSEDEEASPRPRKSAPAPGRARPKRAEESDEADEEEPVPRKRKGKKAKQAGSALPLILVLSGVGVLVVGGAVGLIVWLTSGSRTKHDPNGGSVRISKRDSFATGLPSGDITLALSSDDKTLAVAGSGRRENVRVFDLATKKQLYVLSRPLQGGAPQLGIIPGENWLAIALGDEIALHELKTGKPVRMLENRDKRSGVFRLAISPKGDLIVGNHDKDLLGWAPKSGGEKFRRPTQHANYIAALAFSPDGRKLASSGGGREQKVQIWDVASGNLERTLTLMGGPAGRLTFSPDGETLACLECPLGFGVTRSLSFWDVRSGKSSKSLNLARADGSKDVFFMPGGTRVVTTGKSGTTLVLWDIPTAKELAEATPSGRGGVAAIARTSDGTTLIAATKDGTIDIWDVKE
jgi:WD40 repeat protein